MNQRHYKRLFLCCFIGLFILTISTQYYFKSQQAHTLENTLEAVPNRFDKTLKLQVNKIENSTVLELDYETDKTFEGTITIFNLIGLKITEWQKQFESGEQKVEIDISQLVEGQYLIALSDGTQQVAKKFELRKYVP